MTKVHFYRIVGVLADTAPLIAGLIRKAEARQLDVLVYTENQAVAETLQAPLSKLCSQLPPIAFGTDSQQPVSLCWSDDPGHHQGMVINLCTKIPLWFSRFERMAEVIYDNEDLISCKRDSFRFYRDRGYPLKFYDLTLSQSP